MKGLCDLCLVVPFPNIKLVENFHLIEKIVAAEGVELKPLSCTP